jgi:uncharacterized membrane protein YgcG
MLLSILLAISFPSHPLSTCVLDQAQVLSVQELAALHETCVRYDEAGKAAMAVAIVQDLQGLSRPEYANGLFKAWGLGHKGRDDGILFLVALPPADRGIKIEVGYGLEGVLNDGKVMNILRADGIPLLKQGKYGEALLKLMNRYGPIAEAQVDVNAPQKVQPVPGPVTDSLHPFQRVAAKPRPSHVGLWVFTFAMLALLGLVAIYLYCRDQRLKRRAMAEAQRRERREALARDAEAARVRIRERERERVNSPIPRSAPVPAAKPRVHSKVPPTVVHHHYRDPSPVIVSVPVATYEPPREPERPRRHEDSYSSSSSDSSSDSGSSFGGFDGGGSGGGGGDSSF